MSAIAQSIPNVPDEIVFAGIPIHFSEPVRLHIQQEVRALYANRKQLEQDVDALQQLTPVWQPYLTEAGFPTDLRYAALPFATVDPTVYWSLYVPQADALGLRINESVDERLHPIIATEAVINNLKRLREKYHENPVQSLLRHLQANENADYLNQNKDRPILLTADSPPLIWKILARKIAVEQQEPVHRPGIVYLVYVYRGHNRQSLTSISRQLTLPIERFTAYNQWLKSGAVPNGYEYGVLIQVKPDEYPGVEATVAAGINRTVDGGQDTGFPLLVKLDIHEEGLRSSAVFYTINERKGVQAQPCDNAITLAFYGNLTVNAFLNYNEMTEQDVVRPGQIYYLQPKAKRAKIPFHIVRPNQSLRDVSQMYGIRLASILHFNDVEPTQRVRAGRVLWLRKKRPRNHPPEYQQISMEEPEPDTIMAAPPVPAKTDSVKIQPIAPPVQPTADDSLLVITTPDLPDPSPEPVALPARSVEKAVAKVVEKAIPKVVEKAVPKVVEKVVPKTVDKTALGRIHVVTPGQTYYAISRLYGVTPKQLYEWNNLSEQIPLEIGQELIVAPAPKKTVAAPPRESTPKTKPAPQPQQLINNYVVEEGDGNFYHVVKPGQTVYRVALINKVSVEDVVRWNNLKNYSIEVGQYLLIKKPK